MSLGLGLILTFRDLASRNINRAATALGTLDKKTSKAIVQAERFRGAMALGSKVLIGGAGMAYGIGKVVGQAAKMEHTLYQIKALGASEDLNDLRNRFLKMSAALPIGANELGKVAIIAGQLGIKGNAAISKFADTVVKTSKVMPELTPEAAAEGLAKLSIALDIPTNKVDTLASAIYKMKTTTTATGTEVIDATRRFGAFGKKMGMSNSQIIAWSAAFQDAGQSAEVGAGAIMRTLVRMSQRSEKFAKFMGMSDKQFKKAFSSDSNKMVQDFAIALNKIPKAEVGTVLKELGLQGVRTMPLLMSLTKAGVKLEQKFKASANAFKDASTLEKGFGDISQSVTSKLGILGGVLDNLAIKFGTPLLKPIGDGITAVSGWLAGFLDVGEESTTFWSKLALVATGGTLLTGVLFVVGGALGLLFMKLATGVVSMAKFAWSVMKGVFSLGKFVIKLTVQVVQALANFITMLLRAVVSIVRFAVSLTAKAVVALGKFILWLARAVIATVKFAAKLVAQAVPALAKFVLALAKAGVAAIKFAAKMSVTAVQAIANFVTALLRGSVGAARFALTLVANAVAAVVSFATALVTSAVTAISSFVASMAPAIAAAWSFTTALLANPITWIVVGIVALIAVIVLLVMHWETVKSVFVSGFQTIMSWLTVAGQFWSNVFNSIVSIVTGAISTIGGVIMGGVNLIVQVFSTMAGIVSQLVQGLWMMITGNFQGGLAMIMGVGAQIAALGSFMWQSFISFATSSMANLWSIVSTGFNRLVSFIQSIPGRIAGAAGRMFGPVINAANKAKAVLASIKLPSFGGGGGKHFARGGTVAPTLPVGTPVPIIAHAGERVTPPRKLTGKPEEFRQQPATQQVAQLPPSSGLPTRIEIPLILDGKEIARVLQDINEDTMDKFGVGTDPVGMGVG